MKTPSAAIPASIALRLLGRDIYRENGRDEDAATELNTIERLILSAPYRYATPEGRLSLGRFFLLRGADARKVLDQFYDVATKQQPDLVDAYLATAELALGQARLRPGGRDARRRRPRPPPRTRGSTTCWPVRSRRRDRAGSDKALAEALKINPHHVDSLLLQADHLIDSERYAEAEQLLKQVLEVNPHEPRAWAYRAVLAHLRNDPEGEAAARQSALARMGDEPRGRPPDRPQALAEVPLRRGRRRTRNRRSSSTPTTCPPRSSSARTCSGWATRPRAGSSPPRSSPRTATTWSPINLITLRDRLAGFRTLEDDGFVVRMDAREADLYGAARAGPAAAGRRKTLGEKYGVTLPEPVIVEIFPQKKEFAVRTFGLPGADGLLGVCFGRVITANSPASQGEHPSNWEAVLWHEFCHVVTLSKTHNKMPRWLSEGISVYEEEQENPAWGDALNPRYPRDDPGRRADPLEPAQLGVPGPEDAAPPPVRLLRVGPGRRFPRPDGSACPP